MRVSWKRWSGAAGVGLVGLLVWWWLPEVASAPSVVPERAPHLTAAASRGRGVQESPLVYLAVGGGTYPSNTEVSLEQNLLLAREVLPGPGVLLFAGGEATVSVRTERSRETELAPKQALLAELGQIFDPRPGRLSVYRRPRMPASGATLAEFERQFGSARAPSGSPLTLYVTTHGEQGERPAQNAAALWADRALSVKRLAELHARLSRPLRVVVTSCFSGGFAELAFEDADPKRGLTRVPRCGLFAGTWDRETSGCDANPRRQEQEGYSLHVLQALRRRDRDGRALPIGELDANADGRVGWLDAHTLARSRSFSMDVPTTTSERYLREVQKDELGTGSSRLPEERAVIAALTQRLGLVDRDAVRARRAAVDTELDAASEQLERGELELRDAYAELAAGLLGRWPILDDPYHPEFEGTIASEGDAIRSALDDGEAAARFRELDASLAASDERYAELQVTQSMLLRLERAYQTLGLAGALERRGGTAWRDYLALLECERGGVEDPLPADWPAVTP